MPTKMEKIEANKVKLTFEISAEKLEEGIQEAYLANRAKINLQGFRKGKAPRKLIEIQYGKDYFYDDAIRNVLPEIYDALVLEYNLDVVSRPEIEVDEIDNEKSTTVTAEVFVKPEVIIENYIGIHYTKFDDKVTDEEINAVIEKAREQNARLITIEGRPAINGDTVVIDYEGSVDGVLFDGGKAEGHTLVLGSGTFIPGFEEQIEGRSILEKFDVNVSFPEEYHSDSLAGKSAVFKVELNEIMRKELPEVNDDFAEDVSEFNTLDNYKDSIKKKLSEEKAGKAKDDKEAKVLEALVNLAEIDVPEIMIENEASQMMRDFSRNIQRQGISFDDYCMYTGLTAEKMMESYKITADKSVKTRLVLEEIAKKEGLEASEEEFLKEIDRMAEEYKLDKEKIMAVTKDEQITKIKQDLIVQKAFNKIIDTAVLTK